MTYETIVTNYSVFFDLTNNLMKHVKKIGFLTFQSVYGC